MDAAPRLDSSPSVADAPLAGSFFEFTVTPCADYAASFDDPPVIQEMSMTQRRHVEIY
jgi:hypothetical protein